MRHEKVKFDARIIFHGIHVDLFTIQKHDIIINIYNLRHTCKNKTKNHWSNAKFISTVFRERITKHPNK